MTIVRLEDKSQNVKLLKVIFFKILGQSEDYKVEEWGGPGICQWFPSKCMEKNNVKTLWHIHTHAHKHAKLGLRGDGGERSFCKDIKLIIKLYFYI